MNVISNPDDKEFLKDHLNEFVDCQIRKAADNDLAKDIIDDIVDKFKESHGITSKIARQAGMILYKQNQSEINNLAEDVDTLVEIASK